MTKKGSNEGKFAFKLMMTLDIYLTELKNNRDMLIICIN